jgi:hypothetical protein
MFFLNDFNLYAFNYVLVSENESAYFSLYFALSLLLSLVALVLYIGRVFISQ